jgi:hypothetical protein
MGITNEHVEVVASVSHPVFEFKFARAELLLKRDFDVDFVITLTFKYQFEWVHVIPLLVISSLVFIQVFDNLDPLAYVFISFIEQKPLKLLIVGLALYLKVVEQSFFPSRVLLGHIITT